MAKILNAYRMITAAVIKANADIPNQGDMTVVGTTVECVDITTQKIRNAIGAGVNTESGLATASGINHWSGFGPTKRTLTGGNSDTREIVNSDPTENYKQGDFAGYNHAAITPAWHNKASAEIDKWIDNGGNATFIASIDIGEVRYTEDLAAAGNIVGIALVAYEYGTSTVKAFGITNINDCGIAADLTAVTSSPVYLQTRYDLKVFFVSSLIYLDIVCRVPNITDGSCYVKIKQATHLTIDTAGFEVYPTNGNGDSGIGNFNLSAGQCSFDDAVDHSNSYTGLSIDAELLDWKGDRVGSLVNLFSGAYTAGTHIGYKVAQPAGTNIPSTGYWFKIVFTSTE